MTTVIHAVSTGFSGPEWRAAKATICLRNRSDSEVSSSAIPSTKVMFAAALSLCRPKVFSASKARIVMGIDQEANSPTTRHEMLRDRPWIEVPTVLVTAAQSGSVPTAVAGWMPNSSTSNGGISDPPPTPVKPTIMPTQKPEIENSGLMSANMVSIVLRQGGKPCQLHQDLCDMTNKWARSGKSSVAAQQALAAARAVQARLLFRQPG